MASISERRDADDHYAQFGAAITRMTIAEGLETREKGGSVDQTAAEHADTNTSMPSSSAVVEWYGSM